MAKRSDFKRKTRDFYPTPKTAVLPLLPFLDKQTRFCEPCAGDGRLVDHLKEYGHICARARDIAPGRDDIEQKDALTTLTGNIECFITNPPWPKRAGEPTVSMALFLSSQHPTWLLLPADLAYNKYFVTSGLSARCHKIVVVGRVSWEGNGVSGKDNCAWYLFGRKTHSEIKFYPKVV